MRAQHNNVKSNWPRIIAQAQNSNYLKQDFSSKTMCNPIDEETLHKLEIPAGSTKNFPCVPSKTIWTPIDQE